MSKAIVTALCAALYVFSSSASAIEILCSKKPKSALELEYEKDEGGFAVSSDTHLSGLSLNELFEEFSRGAGVKSKQPILLCLFPQTHPNTIALFQMLGIDNNVISTFFNERRITIRRNKLVRSDTEMLACVASTYPSLGYIEKTPAASSHLKCF